jgi:hypothetical protein
VMSSDDSDALLITGAAGLSALNAFLVAETDVSKYRFVTIQITATATAGAYMFECSNNNVNWVPIRLQEIGSETVATIVTVTAGSRVFHGGIGTKFFRVRISTAFTGGVGQGFATFSQLGTDTNYKPLTDTQMRATAINTTEVSVARTPTLIRATAAGTIAVNARSASIYNAGNANGTVLGTILKPGESVPFDAGAQKDLLAVIAYDATGTEFLVSRVG